MIKSLHKYLSFLILALLQIPLYAQDVKYGLQANLSRPLGDLDPTWYGQIGYGFGLHSQIELKSGNRLIPRVDFMEYKHDNLGQIYKFNTLSLGLDFQHRFSAKYNEKFYLTGGTGYTFARNSFEITDAAHPVPGGIYLPNYSRSERFNAPYLAVGIGYAINSNFSLETRYNYLKFNSPTEATTPSLQLSLLFHL